MYQAAPERQEASLNHKRAVILLISVGGGLQIPMMEGDKIRIRERENKAAYYWFPLCNDGKTLDLTRVKKGTRCERYLHPRFFEKLRQGNNLISVNITEFIIQAAEPKTEETVKEEPEPVQPAIVEKRRPLLRLPVWGLPPRWH
jgi:hypothetical protein